MIAYEYDSFTLGAEATGPLDRASAYAPLASLALAGTRCEPTPVTQVFDFAGRPLTDDHGRPVVSEDSCQPNAIPRGVATTLAQIMRKDVKLTYPSQDGVAAYDPGHEIAGKTGTAQITSPRLRRLHPPLQRQPHHLQLKRNQDVGDAGSGRAAQSWHDAMGPS